MSKLVQFVVVGLSAGAIYALIGLGLVVIYRASRVLNLAQGALLAFGAFVTWTFMVRTPLLAPLDGVPAVKFLVAMAIAIAATVALAMAFELTVVQRMVGQPLFSIILVTSGLDIVLRTVIDSRLPVGANAIGSPLVGGTTTIGGATVAQSDLWTVAVAAVVVAGFFVLFERTRTGLAIRITAEDAEAAQAMGVSLRRVYALSWGIAGALAVLAAVFQLSKPGQGLEPTTALFAFRALPAMVLGGFDSATGTLLAAVLIGLMESYFQFYQPDFLGNNFHLVAPYALMVAVLLVRPHGLLGARAVERV